MRVTSPIAMSSPWRWIVACLVALLLSVEASADLSVSPSIVAVTVGQSAEVRVRDPSGTLSIANANPAVARVVVADSRLTVTGLAAGNTRITISDRRDSTKLSVIVTGATPPPAPAPTATSASVIAWNDLGMHCVDGKDYSIFSILPPFNNLRAQVVNKSTGKLIRDGITLSYESVPDATGSINTRSVDKTNFWTYAGLLFGVNLPPEMGLAGFRMANRTPAPMTPNAAIAGFAADGIPITPVDDAGAKNFYPMVKVVARNSTGTVLGATNVVLPVSDEMTCKACHASRTVGNPAELAAQPSGGWAFDTDPERDWKWNIVRLHDDKNLGKAAYQQALAAQGYAARGLVETIRGGRPVLCAGCHASNALPGTGLAGISALTAALHTRHAPVKDPLTGIALESSDNRTACYQCHPGSETQCLRGAMGNALDAAGKPSMNCQSCHGSMLAVGKATRTGWLDQPNCQSCHFDGKRVTTSLDAAGNLRRPADTRFATNANVPAAGFSLYRLSKGHGGLQCEACHGPTHAEAPSSHDNDNVQNIALQGYAGTLTECSSCHRTVPLTTSGGPHGMHTIGQAWVGAHGDRAEDGGAQACTYCHGTDFRGSPLSAVKIARNFNADGRRVSFPAGKQVGCYDCHDGPRGD